MIITIIWPTSVIYYDSGLRRAGLKHNLNCKGWNSRVQREFPENIEPTDLSSNYNHYY